jgi:hypothetical protein
MDGKLGLDLKTQREMSRVLRVIGELQDKLLSQDSANNNTRL